MAPSRSLPSRGAAACSRYSSRGATRMSSRILVVDDDRATCRLMALGLEGAHHVVETAGSVAQAQELARSFEPQVVLTDLNMSGRSGLELCRDFADRWPDVPVIVVT